MDIEVKLKKFSQVVLKEAELYFDDILYKVDEEFVASCADYQKKAELEMKQQLAEEEKALEHEVLKTVTAAKMAAKKEVLQKKDALMQSVFDEAAQQIHQYMLQDQYTQFIIAAIQQAKTVFGDGGGQMTAYMLEKDRALFETVTGQTSVKVVPVEETGNFIGGVKIVCQNNNIQIDASIGTKLEKARHSLQQHGFIQ